MFRKRIDENHEFTREELQDILTGVKELSMEDLTMIFGGMQTGDDREEYTTNEAEIEIDIFGTKF